MADDIKLKDATASVGTINSQSPLSESPNVTTAVIRSFERDVRTLLDHLDTEYVGPDLASTIKRLRRVVGYSS